MLGCAACTTQAQDPGHHAAPGAPSTTTPEPGQDTLARLKAAIGNAACTDSGQCRTVPVGARACGGPEGYLAYSTAGGQEAALWDGVPHLAIEVCEPVPGPRIAFAFGE